MQQLPLNNKNAQPILRPTDQESSKQATVKESFGMFAPIMHMQT